jgi:hypothetical protein
VFEEFLGAPLLAHKIESNYDVVAQLLNEMCDAGAISTSEPNALREVVEVEGWIGKLLGGISIPGFVPLPSWALLANMYKKEARIHIHAFDFRYVGHIFSRSACCEHPCITMAKTQCSAYLE